MTAAPAPVTEVAPGLHHIELMGGFVAAYLLDLDGELVLVDSGPPGSEDAILGALGSLGHAASRLQTIVLTHAHLDHSGSAAAVRVATGARILLSEVDAELIAGGWSSRGVTIQPGLDEPPPAPPGVRLEDLVEPSPIAPFQVDGHLEAGAAPGLPGVEAIPAPGHCAGQMALLWHRHGGALICGDALVNFGEITIAPIGEDFDRSHESARALAGREFEIAVFGHGDPVVGGAAAAVRAAVGELTL
jgi:glyoxylase-like metal-dependent hydrolase (beta-lactamase superfamily II)